MKIAVFTCDFHNEPKIAHYECTSVEGVGGYRVTYVTESGSTHIRYSSKRGDISWDKESVTITLLYEEERDYKVVMRNLVKQVFASHQTACEAMRNKFLEEVL